MKLGGLMGDENTIQTFFFTELIRYRLLWVDLEILLTPFPVLCFHLDFVDVSSQLFHPLCDKQYSVMERVLGPKARDILCSSCHTAVIQPVRVSVPLNAKCMIGPNDRQSPIQLYSQSPVKSPFSVEEHHCTSFSSGPSYSNSTAIF